MYKVFVQTTNGIITSINSDAFLTNLTGWVQIDEGNGDKFMHAQGNYLPKSIMTEQGVYRYKLVGGKVVERTSEEMQVDIDAIPPPPPTTENKLAQVEEKLTAIKPLMTEMVKGKPADIIIQTADFILPWKEGDYKLDDVRLWEGQPRRCCQAHDSTGNSTWTPAMASLWAPYHGTTLETALPWIAPTGAQDMYKQNEYMIFDEKIYKCIVNTDRDPTVLPNSWQEVDANGDPVEPVMEEPGEGEEPQEPVEKNSNGTDAWSEWIPWNSHPATLYKIGDRVTLDGTRYIATLDGNHWSPASGTGWAVAPE